jgi:hypothetical protein
MAFQGLLTASLDNEPSITGDVILNVSVIGLPEINELDVLDFVDYFRTENNINFLVTEDGNLLEI